MTAQIKALIKQSKGFTLIELLVVIGILGVLAAALIATIDPFEQIRKAQDTNVKDIAVQYVDANVRYYTTHSVLPWGVAAANCNAGAAPSTTPVNLGANGMAGCLNAMIADGELKSAFTGVTTALSALSVVGTTESVTACFMPVSKAQKSDPNTKYNADGSLNQTGQCGPASTTCYWCTF